MDLRDFAANDFQMGQTYLQVVAEGPAAGTRVLLVQPTGGIHARLLLDRGMDIGAAWFGGQPISWLSSIGEQRPGHCDDENGWHKGWAGGLMTTCGLHNVGLPSEGYGRHGSYTDSSAENVQVHHRVEDGGSESIEITATMHDHDAVRRGLVLRRRMVFQLGKGQISVVDSVENQSNDELQAPILYHINFGHPFLEPESALAGEIKRSVLNSRPDEAFEIDPKMGAPRGAEDEVVEHEVAARDGLAQLKLTSPKLGMTAAVAWRTDELPRVHTWRRPRPGSYVHAIEPANCSVNGRLFDRESGRAPFLKAGQIRQTEVRIDLYEDRSS